MECPICGFGQLEIDAEEETAKIYMRHWCGYSKEVKYPAGFPNYFNRAYWSYADNGTLTDFNSNRFLIDILRYFNILDKRVKKLEQTNSEFNNKGESE